ncbi:hypothetical protein [Allopontixanthobacter sediminis]|uniref:hypothetical protein n=1 Tax=Allopontixanthobacter sediminis TaxID=1689985 RepID=UPI001E40FDB3|nr:hypothetical protein [Allopontixanthobacter sediminis]
MLNFLEQCLRDEVRLIAITGKGASALEFEIDLLVIGDGNDDSRFLVTSEHEDETFDEALEFASGWFCERDGLLEVRL